MSVLELVGAPSAMGRGASGCCVCAELTGNCNCTGCAGDAATACSGAAAVDVAVGGGVSVAQVPHRSPPHSEQQYALAGRCLMRHCVHDHAHRCRALMRGCPQLGQYGPGLRASPIRTPQSRSCERSVWGGYRAAAQCVAGKPWLDPCRLVCVLGRCPGACTKRFVRRSVLPGVPVVVETAQPACVGAARRARAACSCEHNVCGCVLSCGLVFAMVSCRWLLRAVVVVRPTAALAERRLGLQGSATAAAPRSSHRSSRPRCIGAAVLPRTSKRNH